MVNLAGHTDPAGPGPVDAKNLIGEILIQHFDGIQNAGSCHRAGPLNVVIKGKNAVAILIEQGKGVLLAQILPLHQRLRITFADLFNKLIHECGIRFSGQALVF